MSIRFFMKSFLITVLILSNSFVFAQKTELNATPKATFNDAVNLYNNSAYAAAQERFKTVSSTHKNTLNIDSDVDYYIAMCALQLQQPNAEKLVLGFVKNYPNNSKKETIFLQVGHYYFNNRQASKALKWYLKADIKNVPTETQKELNFKIGYSLLALGKLETAKARFYPLIEDKKYGNESKYYYGFIAYKLKDNKVAEKYLSEVSSQKNYSNDVSYYLLDIHFKDGQFEKAITLGKELLATKRQKEASEISKIIGESYFNLKKYKEAIPYLAAYKGKRGKWNNTDYYLLGYAYYKQNDYEKAVKNFNKIIGETNSVSQNASYHLAECYLYLDKKTEALHAFKNASEMNFNATIKEDAFLNYAKLSYESGNPYKSVALVLQDFLKAYPKSPQYNEINTLIVTSYIHQQDYQGALNYLSKKKNSTNNQTANEVSFYRAVQLFNKQKLQEARVFFIKATNSLDVNIKMSALFWKAETDYQLQNYEAALKVL